MLVYGVESRRILWGGVDLGVSWVLLVAGSVVSGTALVALLMAPRRSTLVFGSLVMGGVVASFAGLFAIAMDSGRIEVGVVSGLIGFLVFGLAYSVGTATSPRLLATRDAGAVAVPGDRRDRAAVVLSTCVEPTTYSPQSFASRLAEYDATGVPLPPWSARPMVFAAERARYRAAGGTSPGRGTCRDIAADLEDLLSDDARCFVAGHAWCTSQPSLAGVVSQAVADGAYHVIVVQLAVAESLRGDMARSGVDALSLSKHGVTVTYTPPLWGSRVVVDGIVERISSALSGDDPNAVGICLVGHGQPAEWHATHPSWIEHETFFHQRIRAHIEEHGVPAERVKLAWLDWAEPDVTETVRHLAALGSREILVVPASMPVETLSTLVDLRQAVALARVPETTNVTIMDAWGRDEAVARELAARVRTALDER